MVFIQVFGYRVRVHLDVREFGRVSLEVNFEIAFGRESATAYVAFERSFSGVRPDVYLESRITAEHLSAVTTSMFEERLVSATRSGIVGRSPSFSVLPKRQFVRQIVRQQTLASVV